VYLKTIHNQLSAIFNHAVKFYDLPSNPAQKAGNMGKEKSREMLFWTQAEYQHFAKKMMTKPISFYAFEVLYWAGLRLGELLALTKKDIDFRHGIIRINKSYQRIDGEDVITEPKTPNSVRNIQMPEFLAEELKDYIDSLYGVDEDDRIFPISKSYLHDEMAPGCAATGVKKIRIHDIRHSHVSLLIDMGFSAVAIANRVGHESIDITYRYAHLFPTRQDDMASKLNDVRC
jgi:integrase